MLILLAINYFAVLFLNHGVEHYEFGYHSNVVGNWRGFLIHKNLAGSVTAFTVLIFMFDQRNVPRTIHGFIIFLSLIFLYFTQSKSSIAGVILAILGGFFLQLIDYAKHTERHETIIRRVILAALTLPLIAVYFGDQLQRYVDPYAFTGRMRIWSTLILYARDHFWTGAGFGSFWRVGEASPVFSLDESWVTELVPAGHNGYLDLMVSIGFPGLVLAVLTLLILPTRRLLSATSIPVPCRSLFFSIIVFYVWHNLAESQFIDGKAIDQLFLTITIALIELSRPLAHFHTLPAVLHGRWQGLRS
jgi:O-antigen ligase